MTILVRREILVLCITKNLMSWTILFYEVAEGTVEAAYIQSILNSNRP